MRRDFDYVTMSDYATDTRELAAHATNVIAQLKQDIAAREALIWHILRAAGGKIELPESALDPHGMPQREIVKWRNEADMTIVFEARPPLRTDANLTHTTEKAYP